MILTILKFLLLFLLILLLLVLFVLLLVLFLPIGYTIDARKKEEKEPEGEGEPAALERAPKEEEAYAVYFHAGWLFNLLRFGGKFNDKGLNYRAKALWITLLSKETEDKK